MKQGTKTNLVFLIFFCIVQILDIITTYIGLELGAIEINPLGFNPFIVLMKIILILIFIIFFFLTLKMDNIAISLTLLFCLTLLSVFYCCIVVNNFFVIWSLL